MAIATGRPVASSMPVEAPPPPRKVVHYDLVKKIELAPAPLFLKILHGLSPFDSLPTLPAEVLLIPCLLYTSDAADEL